MFRSLRSSIPKIFNQPIKLVNKSRSFSSRSSSNSSKTNERIWKDGFNLKMKENNNFGERGFNQFCGSFSQREESIRATSKWEAREESRKSSEGNTNNNNNNKSGPFDSESFWQARFYQEHVNNGPFRRGRRRNVNYSCKSSPSFIARYHCRQRKRLKTGMIYLTANAKIPKATSVKASFLTSHPQYANHQVSPFKSSPQLSHQSSPPSHYYHPISNSLLSTSIRPPSSLYTTARLLSTSAKQSSSLPEIQVLEAGLPVLIPLLTFLKSSTALSSVTWVSRIALTLLPISIRAKIIHTIESIYRRDGVNASRWIKRMVESRVGVGALEPSTLTHRVNSNFIAPGLLLLPIILLGSIILASFERTPISGRNRIIMVSPEEEKDLVKNILDKKDWPAILQDVLGLEDEGYSKVTGRRILLGGEVLNESDWRVRWTSSVLRALEAGIPIMTNEVLVDQTNLNFGQDILIPPPSKFPLKARGIEVNQQQGGLNCLNAEYDLLVIDRQESNAFSFGFGPDEKVAGAQNGKRGVIVVYSGFLDEILGIDSSNTNSIPKSAGFLNTLFPRQVVEPIMPTLSQTKSLATLLSHELAHLLLSHTLESYANTTLLIPQLQRMCSDIFRTLIFPVTALLGPWINDGIGKSMNELGRGGPGYLGRVCNSCESRKLEIEADVVGLRLLAYAAIDPRHALKFWEDRLAISENLTSLSSTSSNNTTTTGSTTSNHLRLHSAAETRIGEKEITGRDACGFLRTHPVNVERLEKIREELNKWIEYGRIHS